MKFRNMGDRWRNLIIHHLGSRLKQKTSEIRSNVLYVDLGLKPSYLLDFGVRSLQSLINLVKDLKSNQLTESNLKAVEIGMDYLIVNPDLFVSSHSELTNFTKFVDISSNRKTAELLEKCKATDKVISTCICMVTKESWDMTRADDINLTSVFGYLIGYPVVYWFDSDSLNSTGTSQDVQHTEVVGVRADGQTDVVYSFSYPDSLSDVLENHVNKWFQNWQETANWQKLFESVSLKNQKRTLTSMVL